MYPYTLGWVLKLTSQASGNHDLERPFALLKISSFPNEFKIGLTTLRLRERGCRALKDDTLLPEERKERDEEIVSGGKGVRIQIAGYAEPAIGSACE